MRPSICTWLDRESSDGGCIWCVLLFFSSSSSSSSLARSATEEHPLNLLARLCTEKLQQEDGLWCFFSTPCFYALFVLSLTQVRATEENGRLRLVSTCFGGWRTRPWSLFGVPFFYHFSLVFFIYLFSILFTPTGYKAKPKCFKARANKNEKAGPFSSFTIACISPVSENFPSRRPLLGFCYIQKSKATS